jgi:hypothetical protein
MKGLGVRTTSLGFRVLRLHYSADPDKDPATEHGARWYEEARKGMPDARWRQEYELDYGALSGQLVFPTFEETIHVVPDQLPVDSGRNVRQRRKALSVFAPEMSFSGPEAGMG